MPAVEKGMRARPIGLNAVMGLTAAGLIACGTGSVATAGAPGPVGASPGSGAASPVIVTMPPVPVTSPSHSQAGGGRILPHHRPLTVADDGASVLLRPGQVVVVVLASGALMWDVPQASGNTARRISASGGYPTRQSARAVFRAIRPGRSWVTSFTDAPCLHEQPKCAIPQRLWRLLIIVQAHP